MGVPLGYLGRFLTHTAPERNVSSTSREGMENMTRESSSVEQIMRRADELGLSSERVARALNYRPEPPAELQHTVKLARPPLRSRLFARRSRAQAAARRRG